MYSRYGLFGILIVMILPVMVSIAMAKEIENILPNPDFEDKANPINGWSIGAQGTLSMDKKAESPTSHPVMLATINAAGANAWEPEIHSPGFDLKQGKKYTYAFWAKTEPGVTRTLGARFEQLNTWVGIGQDILINDQWQDYHFTGIWTHPSSPPQVVIHIAFNVQPKPLADVWFSHFRVYEGDYVEEEIGGGKPKAVNPVDRLTTAWGQIKKF
ncbi:hypothetical protein FJZ31_14390 [Candidatus Poribacteria bacterium]|nr:hypothetical protein [Candidatus Poribacteria bacterium]